MVTEAFHNILKGLYFQRRQNRRVDHLLCKLLKIARDKMFEGLIKSQKGKRTHKVKETDKRHKKGEEIKEDDVLELERGKWNVRSQEDKSEFYSVRKVLSTCDCLIHCSKCQVCHHMYRCECTDFRMRLIACKHIHAIHIRESSGVESGGAAGENGKLSEKSTESIEYFEDLLRSTNDQQERLRDIDTLRINILRRISDLTEIVQSSTSPLALRTATAHVNSAITTRKERKKLPKSLSLPSAAERKDIKAMLIDEVPQVCAFCFKENDARGDEDVEWVECPQCCLWAHWECDGNGRIEGAENYLCSICYSGQSATGDN
eukprot:Seg3290.1 transcript_id=Seg3290.1/GoldUCD/mRNA.D3Y31 product="hypothetical protein" protein_id=Seg3290.1/GoldUCD/D3Y31